ncbi:MAG: hypothetical protein MJZ16_10630 [Bacteroidales bacterium]|nr:hypothetical protein [Bacteroidales bacterium]
MEKWEEIIKKNLADSKASLPEDDFALFQEKLNKSKAGAQSKKAAVVVPFAKIAKIAAPALAACAAVALAILHPFGVEKGLEEGMIQTVQREDVLADMQEGNISTDEVGLEDITSSESSADSNSSLSQSSIPAKAKRNPQRVADAKPFDEMDSKVDAESANNHDTEALEPEEKKTDASGVVNPESSKQQTINGIMRETSPSHGLGGYDPIIRDRKGGKVALTVAGVSGGTALGVLASAVIAAGGPFPKSNDAFEPAFDYGYSYFNPVNMENFNDVAGVYRHIIPLKAGLTARIPVAGPLYLMSGVEYSVYSSTIEYPTHTTSKQVAHYLGIPVRLDWAFASAGKFDFYLGAGGELDFCIAARKGEVKVGKDKPVFCAVGATGVQYNFSKILGVYIEPQICWCPGSGENNLSTYRSKHPVYLSGAAGIRFNL